MALPHILALKHMPDAKPLHFNTCISNI